MYKRKNVFHQEVKDFFICTGIGHRILLFVWQWLGNCLNWVALIRFHFARRFCHHIFTWISVKFKLCAICERSINVRYFFCWNSASSSNSCSLVKAVRLRRTVVELLFNEELSSSSLSLVVGQFKLSKYQKDHLGWSNRKSVHFVYLNGSSARERESS